MDFNPSLVGYILSSIEGLSPEGRFLLLCLLYEYSIENKAIDISVKQLTSKYGVTRTVCSEVSKFLSLPKNKLGQIRRSKVRCCEFDSVSLSKFSSDFDNGQYGNVHHFTVVDLLTKKSTVDGVKNECDLSVSNLLLLIILLIHSDSSGSVERLSKAKIRKMMGGISDDCLNSQLKKLSEKGCLFISCSGGSGRKLFGKVSNNYILNCASIKPKEYSLNEAESVRFFSDQFSLILEKLEAVVRKLHFVRCTKGWKKNAERNDLFILFGSDLDASMRIMNLILNKCECIISVLLTECWSEINDDFIFTNYDLLNHSRIKPLMLGSSLFSLSVTRDEFSFDKSNLTSKEISDRKREQREKVEGFRLKEIVTLNSLKQWGDSHGIDNKSLDSQAHLLIDFLVSQSLCMAKDIKNLIVNCLGYADKPDWINVIFNHAKVNGTVGDNCHMTIALALCEQVVFCEVISRRLAHNDVENVVKNKIYVSI
ncbi:hypothetical protein [Aliivibrio fischeri]